MSYALVQAVRATLKGAMLRSTIYYLDLSSILLPAFDAVIHMWYRPAYEKEELVAF